MTDALQDHEGTVSIGGRTITNLRFADDIDGLAGEEEELTKLVECLDKAYTAYGMEISAEKTKLMTNNTSGINTEITVNGQKLELQKNGPGKLNLLFQNTIQAKNRHVKWKLLF